ncbi:MAG: type II toxin-antitoxin system prevent-host-death family antitoxin [Chloroflexi bacterium]|nr:type II toxin-antitoxin system prevent-host-death family antitoxin [Chloroflexota bacterium]
MKSMKRVELAQAKTNLELQIREAKKSLLIVTKNGKPVAALVPVDDFDLEVLATSENPTFLAIMEHSRLRAEKEGTISEEEMRREFGLPEKGKGRP